MMGVVHRVWQLLPRRFRREFLFSATAGLAPRPPLLAPAATAPVTVAGYLAAPSGLGQGARNMLATLRAHGVPSAGADLTRALRHDVADPAPPAPGGPGTLIVHVNGPMLPWGLFALGRHAVRERHVIGYWAWELPHLPADWDRGYRFVHQVWAPSAFAADAMRRVGGPPISVVPYVVAKPQPAPLSRADLGLPEDAFIALCIFNAASSVDRKNPLATVRAFQAAFGTSRDHLLVLKTMRTSSAGEAWHEVAAAVAGAPNIRVIEATMPEPEVHALMQAADCVIGLHRSEGFGLPLAEAMALGKPVVATDWSGNTDFMTPANSRPVAYRLRPAVDRQDTFTLEGAEWAEADVEDAAAALRELAGSAELRAALGRRAAEDIAAHASPAAVMRRMAARINFE